MGYKTLASGSIALFFTNITEKLKTRSSKFQLFKKKLFWWYIAHVLQVFCMCTQVYGCAYVGIVGTYHAKPTTKVYLSDKCNIIRKGIFQEAEISIKFINFGKGIFGFITKNKILFFRLEIRSKDEQTTTITIGK